MQSKQVGSFLNPPERTLHTCDERSTMDKNGQPAKLETLNGTTERDRLSSDGCRVDQREKQGLDLVHLHLALQDHQTDVISSSALECQMHEAFGHVFC